MEQSTHGPEVYDFRQYDRIWQRVAPTLEPYPASRGNGQTEEAPQNGQELTLRKESQLPGAEENPCCMGSAAAEMLEVLTGFVEETLEDRRKFLMLSRQAPAWARQALRDMAGDEEAHARRLMAAYYLITGACYRPRVVCDGTCTGQWCPALRERYHAEACNGLNYQRAAEGTTDPCLRRMLEELGAEEYRHADRLMRMLERSMAR